MNKGIVALSVVVILAFGRVTVAAGLLGATAAGIDLPLLQTTSSETFVFGQLQAQFTYGGENAWAYEKASSEYAGVFPVGIKDKNIVLKVYPNVNSVLPVLAMAASEAELSKKIEYQYDKKTQTFSFKEMNGLLPLARDPVSGRYCFTLTLTPEIGTDSHSLRFYALIQDAKKKDHAFLMIFRWTSKKPGIGLVETFQFDTEKWPENWPTPSLEYFTDLVRRAGCSGHGLVYPSLLADDAARKNESPKEETIDEGARAQILEAKGLIADLQEKAKTLAAGTLTREQFVVAVADFQEKNKQLSLKFDALVKAEPRLMAILAKYGEQCAVINATVQSLSASSATQAQFDDMAKSFQSQINDLAAKTNVLSGLTGQLNSFQAQTCEALNILGRAINANSDATSTVDRNTQRLTAEVDELRRENARLKADVTDLKGWADAFKKTPQPLLVSEALRPTPTIPPVSAPIAAAPAVADDKYAIAFCRGRGTWCEQADIKNLVLESKVYIRCYQKSSGKWVTGFVPNGVLNVNGDKVGSRLIYWSLDGVNWQTLPYTVSSTTKFIVVPTGEGGAR
ncbi:MAG: hypothetical protein NTW50_04770 [Candidatus Berkelbacteria bacterium]|nr:hypothetical protein [Candidatus Berkelbacteria bacterium]